MNAHVARFLAVVALATVAFAGSADANAPAGRYTTSGGTVYDTKTKLTWQQTVPSGTYTWAGAKAYCAGLNLGGSGWRLPTAKELQTIVDDSRTNPAIDPTAFPSTPSDYFWSSSPLAGSSSNAWFVLFGYGSTDYYVVSFTYSVRCVR
jgi:formylglycine-generating enzyme required for sulfatase activity